MDSIGRVCVKAHRFQQLQISLPLKHKPLFIEPLHMDQYGKNYSYDCISTSLLELPLVLTQLLPVKEIPL
jgi:hypothetical protein